MELGVPGTGTIPRRRFEVGIFPVDGAAARGTKLRGNAFRASSGIAYGLVAVAFLWDLVGALTGVPKWVVDLTPFEHVGLVPVQPFQPGAAAIMVAIGAVAALGAIAAFKRRDLLGA